ncbi:WD-40 repeat-containing protein [Reticulomyxa filosa]|uniref:WD-40 repeat-containing protein n=1 Tax=Reticulomyxa filosa TaxID=46433 RepID=X6LVL8_RETFI|nr:WD-40 repeat-containing protein [Reticulomyxa filosa]|eukprot:ETO05968.1 WD-40 repeat-containing protein [Reticulomyxa filosa]
MLDLKVERDEKNSENEKETFSSFGCYNKDWILLTNKPQKLNSLICCVCKQIANNAVELQCDEHENIEQAHLIGEECLQMYLKQNNGKCPIQQHEHCEFSKSKVIRQQISELLVICPRQYDLKKKQLKKGTISGEKEKEKEKDECNYKGKIKEMKDHLDKSCQLISIQQIISFIKELQSQLQNEKLQTVLSLFFFFFLEYLEFKNKRKIIQKKKGKITRNVFEKINSLQNEYVKKDEQITEMTNNIQQLKLETNQTITQLKKKIEQYQNVFDTCTKLNEEIKHLKSEKELNEMKQNEEILKINNTNQILKQQLDNRLNEIEQLKKEIKSKNNHQINIKLDEDKKENYYNNISSTFNFDLFCSSSKLINTFIGHTNIVRSIDYSTFNDCQFICSGSNDKTVGVWNFNNNKQIQSFNGHSDHVYCDDTIRFWDFKHNKKLQIFNRHTNDVCSIEFSSFNSGRYLCSGSYDKTIRLWDIETSKSLHIFNGHENWACCVDISPLKNNNNKNDNKSNNIGLIGGNGYTICSGSFDKTIRIWDIETTKQLITFNGHEDAIRCVKYGLNELVNIILSGSNDKSVRLWDIRSNKQIEIFNGHKNIVWSVEYSPFIINNNSNVICSGSTDKTIRFWDIRSNKNELYVMKSDEQVICFKFIEKKLNNDICVNLCYGSTKGLIYVFG